MLQKFADMKVGTRIITGYIIALVLMAIVGGVSIWRISEIGTTVDGLVNDIAVDRQIANQIQTAIVTVRLRANQYIANPSVERTAVFDEEWAKYKTLLEGAATDITNPERAAILEKINTASQEYDFAFNSVEEEIAAREAVYANVLDVNAAAADTGAIELMKMAIAKDDIQMLAALPPVRATMIQMRVNAARYILAGDEEWALLMDERYAEVTAALQAAEPLLTTQQERQIGRASCRERV